MCVLAVLAASYTTAFHQVVIIKILQQLFVWLPRCAQIKHILQWNYFLNFNRQLVERLNLPKMVSIRLRTSSCMSWFNWKYSLFSVKQRFSLEFFVDVIFPILPFSSHSTSKLYLWELLFRHEPISSHLRSFGDFSDEISTIKVRWCSTSKGCLWHILKSGKVHLSDNIFTVSSGERTFWDEDNTGVSRIVAVVFNRFIVWAICIFGIITTFFFSQLISIQYSINICLYFSRWPILKVKIKYLCKINSINLWCLSLDIFGKSYHFL